jgi:hypothetical protein
VAFVASQLVHTGASRAAEPEPKAAEAHTTSPAAQSAPASGHVLAVQASDLILDLSEAQSITAGSSVELWRPIRLRHPVTGRSIADRFRIGTLSITQVRPHLSLAVPSGPLERTPEPGDVVIVPAEPAAAPPPGADPILLPAPARAASATAAAQDADAVTLSQLMDRLEGSSPQKRLAAYAAFVERHPRHRYGPALLDQAKQLRALLEISTVEAEAPALARHEPPELALVHKELSLSVQLASPARAVVVHYKPAASATFETKPAVSAGLDFFALALPAAAVADGGLQYFMEAVDASGKPRALVGTAEAPITVPTRRSWDMRAPPRPGATARIVADYADYNRLRNNDRDFRVEADFGLRLNDLGLRAVRSGFGVYRGVGGTLADLDELGKSAREIGLTYGYLEGEYALSTSFSLIGRALLGLYSDGVSGGLLALARVGSDRATNVQLGGELLGNVGVRGITELSIAPLSRVPIVLRSEVGNQPAGVVPSGEVHPADDGAALESTSVGQSDIGVRGIVQVGYRIWPELVICARASYQGRNIRHSGPGFGGAILYSW